MLKSRLYHKGFFLYGYPACTRLHCYIILDFCQSNPNVGRFLFVWSDRLDQSGLKWNALARPERPCSWIRAAQFSRSGRPKRGNLESSGGKNVRTHLGPFHLNSAGLNGQIESELRNYRKPNYQPNYRTEQKPNYQQENLFFKCSFVLDDGQVVLSEHIHVRCIIFLT